MATTWPAAAALLFTAAGCSAQTFIAACAQVMDRLPDGRLVMGVETGSTEPGHTHSLDPGWLGCGPDN